MDPQNLNARYLDKFTDSKTTSVRIHHPPGTLVLIQVELHLSPLVGKSLKNLLNRPKNSLNNTMIMTTTIITISTIKRKINIT